MTLSNKRWTTYKRIATPSHTLEAKRANGGETIGFEGLGLVAKKGQCLCRNPENGHQWTMDDESFPKFYIPEQIKDQKAATSQENPKPTKKAAAKDRRPASHQDTEQDTDFGPLFNC